MTLDRANLRLRVSAGIRPASPAWGRGRSIATRRAACQVSCARDRNGAMSNPTRAADLGAAVHAPRGDRGRLPGRARAPRREGLRRASSSRASATSRRSSSPGARRRRARGVERARRVPATPTSSRPRSTTHQAARVRHRGRSRCSRAEGVRGSRRGAQPPPTASTRLDDVARERGMTLGYHNHFWELAPMPDGRPALLHLFEHLAPDGVRRGRHLLGAGRRRRIRRSSSPSSDRASACCT